MRSSAVISFVTSLSFTIIKTVNVVWNKEYPTRTLTLLCIIVCIPVLALYITMIAIMKTDSHPHTTLEYLNIVPSLIICLSVILISVCYLLMYITVRRTESEMQGSF